MQIHVKTEFINERVVLEFGKYGNGSIAIRATTLNGEPQFCATVAVEPLPAAGCVFLKGWSENEGIPEALVKAGIVELTGRKVTNGFCEAVEAKLLIDDCKH